MSFHIFSQELVVEFEDVINFWELYFLVWSEKQIFLEFSVFGLEEGFEIFLRVFDPFQIVDTLYEIPAYLLFYFHALLCRIELYFLKKVF